MASNYVSPDAAGPTPSVALLTGRELEGLALQIESLLRHAERIEWEVPPAEFTYYGDEPPEFMSLENQGLRGLWWADWQAREAKAAFDASDYARAKLRADEAKEFLFPGWATLMAARAARAEQALRDSGRKRIELAIEGRRRKSHRSQRDARTEAIVTRLHAEQAAIPRRRIVVERLRAELRHPVTGEPFMAERTAKNYASRAIAKLKKQLKKT
jgi:hypothetical protein